MNSLLSRRQLKLAPLATPHTSKAKQLQPSPPLNHKDNRVIRCDNDR